MIIELYIVELVCVRSCLCSTQHTAMFACTYFLPLNADQSTNVHERTYVNTHACIHTYINTHACMHVRMYGLMYVHARIDPIQWSNSS